MKVVIAEPVVESLTELVNISGKDWVQYKNQPNDKEELISRLADANVSLSYSIKYDDEIFSRCQQLKYVTVPAVGAEMFVDMDAANKHKVTVMNCPGYNSEAVAEFAIMSALSILRKLPAQQKDLQKGLWIQQRGLSLSHTKVGIIGNGNISQTIRKLLAGWKNEFKWTDSKSSDTQTDELMAWSDVIFICCPLNDSTRGLIDQRRISLMSPKSILVNVSRGQIVDEEALLNALNNSNIYAAAIDVFADEPIDGNTIPEDSMIRKLGDQKNALVTFHMGAMTESSAINLGQILFNNLESAAAGHPQNIY